MALLAVIFEMSMYVLYLRSSPARFAALLVDPKDDLQKAQLQDEIMKSIKKEWKTIVEMENKEGSNRLLQQRCCFTRWECYREPMACLELEGWSMTEKAKAVLLSWHPGLAFSANVEQVFAAVEDSCKRGVKNLKASMSNLQCLSIRAVEQKVAANEKQQEAGKTDRPRAVKLGVEDFEGSEALQMDEIGMIFKGSLPAYEVDETKVKQGDSRMQDCLAEQEQVKALAFRLEKYLCRMMAPVEVFSYTIHFVGPRLCDKLGCAAVLRRSASGQTLLVWMIRSKDIVKLTSETLSQWAAEYALQLRRNSTKSAKIRALCQLPAVAAACTPAELKALDDLLNEIDEKRRKRTKAGEAEHQEDDEARKAIKLRLILAIHLLQLLEQVQRQEDEDPGLCNPENNSKEEDDGAAAEDGNDDAAMAEAPAAEAPAAEAPAAEAPAAAPAAEAPAEADDERKRASRRLLSTCKAVPDFLTAKFKMRDDVVITHVEHRSTVLPHFQVRLPGDEKYEGKRHVCRHRRYYWFSIINKCTFHQIL
ncbi:unnamed protein product [Symbiodinium sp. CCMP2592]|nr:unnamed protein product [Symbiodinium sp. CCMP2592]CAE7432052.1 unnamed protein product [Symbiodinium sp. CCMP2592]